MAVVSDAKLSWVFGLYFWQDNNSTTLVGGVTALVRQGSSKLAIFYSMPKFGKFANCKTKLVF